MECGGKLLAFHYSHCRGVHASKNREAWGSHLVNVLAPALVFQSLALLFLAQMFREGSDRVRGSIQHLRDRLVINTRHF